MWHSRLLALSLLLSALFATESLAETDAGTTDKIKSAISHCLVTSTVSSYGIPEDAQMIVGANFNRDGKVKASSLSLIHHSINSDTRANVLFQGIRRAILRCQGAGYLLPSENYDSWKSLTISFSKSDLFKD